jgi:hypothetical protein
MCPNQVYRKYEPVFFPVLSPFHPEKSHFNPLKHTQKKRPQYQTEDPLLPPGMKVNKSNDPGEKLMASLQSWLSDRNCGLAEMTNQEIYLRLHRLGGQNHNPLTCEQIY